MFTLSNKDISIWKSTFSTSTINEVSTRHIGSVLAKKVESSGRHYAPYSHRNSCTSDHEQLASDHMELTLFRI